jgi:hypothetical protein
MNPALKAALAGWSLLLALVVAGFMASVYAVDDGSYADSVDHALEILRAAPAGDRPAASRAADVLEAGTGQSQPEILSDLRRSPPDVADARARLSALSAANRSPAFAPEPGKARRAVHDILTDPRYAALHKGPSLADRVEEALLRLLLWLLGRALSAAGGGLWEVLALAGALVLVALVVVVGRSARWAGRREARLSGVADGGSRRRDRFVEADRLAAGGDYAGAIRELAGGVAEALGDERAWEASPLTVRELFSRASDPTLLWPLLLAFEAAAYGARPPDRETYQRAAAAASRFRVEQKAAA